jgi:formate hydrogenlyase transcriptional activator
VAITEQEDALLELLAELAEIPIQAHTLPTIVTAATKVLSAHLPLRFFELGRCDPSLTTADTLAQAAGASSPARAVFALRGSLARRALAEESPQIEAISTAEPLSPRHALRHTLRHAPDHARAREHGAAALAIAPLRTPEAAGYVLLALGPDRPGQIVLTRSILGGIGRILSVAFHQALVLARVAMVSRRAHTDNRALRDELQRVVLPPDIIARSPAMHAIFHEIIPLVARQTTTVLLHGESGTGKEVIARRIHALSLREHRPFLKVNCGALPEHLVESTLFGHERGSFTGATRRHEGLFERAHGGTLLLDEVGELPSAAQVKLLRVLQEGELERIGGQTTLRVDVRIIAATHRDLEAMARDERFRADLYYRLDVFPILVPPLRDRPEDLDALVPAILHRLAARLGRSPPKISPAALSRLRAYAWPGNVRELENVLERALLMSRDDTLAVPASLGPPRTSRSHAPPGGRIATYEEATRRCIADALSACNGKVYGSSGAAQLLGLKPTTLQSKMKKLGM